MSEVNTEAPAREESNVTGPPVIAGRTPRRNLRWIWLATAVLAAVVAALLFRFNPAEHSFYPFCVFHRVTGYECPGCGGLRAMHQLLHGNVGMAFRFNPLVVGLLPVALVLLARRCIRGPGAPVSHRAMARRAWVAFVVLVGFWIVRNLPIAFLHP